MEPVLRCVYISLVTHYLCRNTLSQGALGCRHPWVLVQLGCDTLDKVLSPCVQLLSRVGLFVTPWTVAHQAVVIGSGASR